MSWLTRLITFIPRHNEVAEAQELSSQENDKADAEQAKAVANAVLSSATAREVGLINYNNGFSVALGSAFAKRGTV